MARYTNDIASKKSAAAIDKIVKEFMNSEGFRPWDREANTWKKGQGIMAGPQLIKVETSSGKVHIEAWIKFAWFPGVYAGELGLVGVRGFAVKAALRSKVKRLEELIIG
jgi:hypothetical protein